MDRQVLKEKKIGVLMGGLSSEREISLRSGNAVLQGLIRKGYAAVPIDADRDTGRRLREAAIDVAFVALHGRWGEDGTIQGLLEIMGIPYTGSGVLGSALAMDKSVTKKLLKYHGIPTAEFVTLWKDRFDPKATMAECIGYPLVVKPSTLG